MNFKKGLKEFDCRLTIFNHSQNFVVGVGDPSYTMAFHPNSNHPSTLMKQMGKLYSIVTSAQDKMTHGSYGEFGKKHSLTNLTNDKHYAQGSRKFDKGHY